MPAPTALSVPVFTAPNELTGAITAIIGGLNTSLAASANPQSFAINLLAASGAINPHISAMYVITKAGLAAMTLGLPTTVVDDGVTITITSSTAFAHTVTLPSAHLLDGAASAVTAAAFPAFGGSSITLMAYAAQWYVMSVNGTFSYS